MPRNKRPALTRTATQLSHPNKSLLDANEHLEIIEGKGHMNPRPFWGIQIATLTTTKPHVEVDAVTLTFTQVASPGIELQKALPWRFLLFGS